MSSTPVRTASSPLAESAPGTMPAGAGEILTDFERPAPELMDRLSRLPLANVSDAMNKLGVLHHALRPITAGTRICGPAMTCGSLDLSVKIFALWLAQPGDVFILAAGGIDDYACFGELSANILVQRGASGAIIDGAVRDVVGIRETGLPVFARAMTPRNYHYPFGQPFGAVNHPVVCGGVAVSPGDIVMADDDGVLVVSRRIAGAVATAAAEIERQEAGRRAGIRAGAGAPAAIEQQLIEAGYRIQPRAVAA